MPISKDSIRIQFTLNKRKEKEKLITEFLDGCIDSNAAIKEILFNYIVTHCDTKSMQVTKFEAPQSYAKSLQESNFDNNIVNNSDNKLVEVSNCENKSQQEDKSELELNELDELKKFI